MYSQASMLRTMERFLGLQPLTQYDAAAHAHVRHLHHAKPT